jgi:hypothetical protein
LREKEEGEILEEEEKGRRKKGERKRRKKTRKGRIFYLENPTFIP